MAKVTAKQDWTVYGADGGVEVETQVSFSEVKEVSKTYLEKKEETIVMAADEPTTVWKK